jgi:hypothetical protein
VRDQVFHPYSTTGKIPDDTKSLSSEIFAASALRSDGYLHIKGIPNKEGTTA